MIAEHIVFLDDFAPTGQRQDYTRRELLAVLGEMTGPCSAHRGIMERFVNYVFDGTECIRFQSDSQAER